MKKNNARVLYSIKEEEEWRMYHPHLGDIYDVTTVEGNEQRRETNGRAKLGRR